ncbi:hypothetical protein N7533_008262 [Penicillium manginii]|uniref:uncharacterized protein n=1 Tax=Penicillium manginii TaxID=203109 RepID=UPI0025488396|nr:uncharacterized protein N7533_008262 [Penicillium manginii]KAJ5751234.1 hypothetical protein N7533_008262 [Penicillium manginii]
MPYHADLETMRKNALGGVEPWASAYSRFSNDSYSLSTYKMQGPNPVISRSAISNYTSFANDARAAYQIAIMCKSSWYKYIMNYALTILCAGYITRNQGHWDRSNTIIDAWATRFGQAGYGFLPYEYV